MKGEDWPAPETAYQPSAGEIATARADVARLDAEAARAIAERGRSLGKGTYQGNLACKSSKTPRRKRVRFQRVDDDAGVVFLPEGHMVRIDLPRPSAAERARARKGGGKRGRIEGLTASARNRQLRRLAMLDRRKCEAWCTCTYPYARRPTGAEFKRHKAKLWDRIRKRWPSAYIEAKREFTKRGVIHLHMLVWGVPVAELAPWLARAFAEVCGNVDYGHIAQRADVQAVSTGEALDWYVCKRVAYCGKAAEAEIDPETGKVVDDPFGRWSWSWGDERPYVSTVKRVRISYTPIMHRLRRSAWRLSRYVRPTVDGDRRVTCGYEDLTGLSDAEAASRAFDVGRRRPKVDGLPRLSRGMKRRNLYTVHLYADPAEFERLVEFEQARLSAVRHGREVTKVRH